MLFNFLNWEDATKESYKSEIPSFDLVCTCKWPLGIY